jgi:hypothetical protein
MGRACQVHNIPNYDCIDCRRMARIRQLAADGRIELASTVLAHLPQFALGKWQD